MKAHKISTPKITTAVLKKYDLRPKKSLGQNFLVEANILEKITMASHLNKATNVIEIGPGIGALTEFLATSAHQVLALEIDQRMLDVLNETLVNFSNVEVVHADILQVDLDKIVAEHFSDNLPLKVVANLPYYITTPILLHLLKSKVAIEQIVVMMQKEVAKRLIAQPNNKAYGSLSIFIQYYMKVNLEFIVKKTVFFPQPKVDSAVISLTKRKNPVVNVTNEAAFFKLVHAAFKMRRKTLWNNLLKTYGKDEVTKVKLTNALKIAQINHNRRAESLTIVEFSKLSNSLIKNDIK